MHFAQKLLQLKIATNRNPKADVRRSIKLANFWGRGLVSKDYRPMKTLNHDIRDLSRHGRQKMADDEDADAFMLLYFLTAKQHKKRTIWARRWSLNR